MRLIGFIILALLFPGAVFGAPLDTYQTFIGSGDPADARRVGNNAVLLRGTGTRNFYYLEVDPVTGAIPVTTAPTTYTNTTLFRQDYTVTPVTTGAWVQIIASTSATIKQLYIFDSSGSVMQLGVGGAGSEVAKINIPPGGSSVGWPLTITAGTRLSIRALDVDATVGQIVITALN
jgi:hypothetical protein